MLRRLVAIFFLTVAAIAAAAPIKLRLSVWDGDEALRVVKQIARQFEKENPGVEVALETFPDYALYHQKMLVQYASDAAPDVAMMDMGHFQALANRKAILPLNPFFAKTPGFDIREFYEPIVKAHSLNGQVYVLPRDIAPMGIVYYNKRAFDEAGIPYPDGTWTWDFKIRPELKEKDFLWVMDRLTKKGANGKTERYGYLPGWAGLMIDSFGFSLGLRYADDPQRVTKITIDTPEWRNIYKFRQDLVDKGWTPSNTEVTAVLQQTATALFVQGKVAMYQNGIWEVPNVRRDMKPGSKNFFDWDIALFPAHASGKRGAPTGGSGYCVFSSTKHPELAWKLTSYLSGPAGMNAMAAAGIAQPAIRKLALSEPWAVGPSTPPDQRYPASRATVLDKAVESVVFGPSDEYWPEVSGIYGSRTQGILDGIEKPEVALAKGQADAQARLNSLRREEKLPPFPWPLGIGVGVAIVTAILLCIYWPERKVKYTYRQRLESRAAYRFLSPWLIGLVLFTVGPMILSLLMATMNWDMIRPAQFRGAGNFREMVTDDPRFWPSIRVTLVYTLVATPLGLLASLALALLLNTKVRGIPFFRAAYYIPTIASAVAMTLVFRKIYSPDDGLLNSLIYHSPLQSWFGLGDWLSAYAGTPGKPVHWLGRPETAMGSIIMMSLLGAGGGMVVLLAGLQAIPQYYYEAATVDGAGPLHRLKNITLPLLTPAIFFSLITGFIGSFQVFTQVFIITGGANGGPDNSLLVFMIAIWSAAFSNLRLGYAAALGWVLFAIVLGFTLLQMAFSKWVYYEADAKG